MSRIESPTLHTKRRVAASVPEQVDVAIIGAGLGGLVSGARLARAGHRVAVFDGHYVAGGCATMFSRGPKAAQYNFDIGLHYLGDCGEDGKIPTILRDVGVETEFLPMKQDGYDTLVFPNPQHQGEWVDFSVPVGLAPYREKLVEMFPSERKGIDRYVRFVGEVDGIGREAEKAMENRGFLQNLSMVAKVALRGRLVAQYQNATIGAVLDDCTQDPLLRAIMLGQNGDYGLPPSRVSALLHAGLVAHYFRGAYYPKGGGQVIADRLAGVIEENGGGVFLRRPVDEIVVENGAAVGVSVLDSKGENRQVVRAKSVVSNADLIRTLTQLLPQEHLPQKWSDRLSRFEMGGALFILFLGLKGKGPGSPVHGLGAGNLWSFSTTDMEALYADVNRGSLDPQAAYFTSGSLKDPGTEGHAPAGFTSLEIMTMVPSDLAAWGLDPKKVVHDGIQRPTDYRKSAEYQEAKAKVESGLLDRLETHYPGARDAVVFSESATPLTHSRYTGAMGGTGYGLAATPEQFLRKRPGYRGPIPGLFLWGASTRSGHGVVGAMMSGVAASRRVSDYLDD